MKKKKKSKVATRKITEFSRWGEWENQVLNLVSNAAECQMVIVERQGILDDDQQEKDLVRAEFCQQLKQRRHDPDRDCIFILAAMAAEWLANITKNKQAVNRATTHLTGLAIPELSRTKRGGRPGWRWCGSDAGPGATSKDLNSALDRSNFGG